MATFSGDVLYIPKMGHLPTPVESLILSALQWVFSTGIPSSWLFAIEAMQFSAGFHNFPAPNPEDMQQDLQKVNNLVVLTNDVNNYIVYPKGYVFTWYISKIPAIMYIHTYM